MPSRPTFKVSWACVSNRGGAIDRSDVHKIKISTRRESGEKREAKVEP